MTAALQRSLLNTERNDDYTVLLYDICLQSSKHVRVLNNRLTQYSIHLSSEWEDHYADQNSFLGVHNQTNFF